MLVWVTMLYARGMYNTGLVDSPPSLHRWPRKMVSAIYNEQDHHIPYPAKRKPFPKLVSNGQSSSLHPGPILYKI